MPRGHEDDGTAFYEVVLGTPRVGEPPHLEERGGCWFESDTSRIHLGVEEDFRSATNAHPALLVSGLAALRSRLEASGVEVVDDVPLPGVDRLSAHGPFGNRPEFLATASSHDPEGNRL